MNHAYTFHQPKYGYPAYRYQRQNQPNYSPEVLAQMADDAAELERRTAWVEAYNAPPPMASKDEKQAQQRAAEAEAAAAWERECAALQAQLDAFNAANRPPQIPCATLPPQQSTCSAQERVAAVLGLVWLALAHHGPRRRRHTQRRPPTIYFGRRLKHNGGRMMMMTDPSLSPTTPATTALPTPLAHSASKGFSFQLLAQQGQARAGLFCTPHGPVQTPMFMPVGTQSTLKTLTWQQVAATGAQMVLSNAYHLYLKPGPVLIAKAGGLHGWMNWQGPILTDSGGFQVFSLAGLRRITEAGVHFTNPTDGSKHFIGPEEAMRIQNQLGADVMMAFDECTPYPATLEEANTSLERTQRWLERCWASHERVGEQALFPIVQGGTHEALRTKAAAHVAQYPAVGYAIGGVSVGEPRPAIHAITAFTAPLLPANKPRYLMGVGTPEDLLEGIKAGVDLFDCVLPTRNARHGTFFSPWGNEHIKKACFTEDFGPLVAGCECFACTQHSRAYIRHLVRQGEVTGSTLLSIHNIHTLIALAREARLHVLQGTFDAFYTERMAQLGTNKAKRGS